MNGQFKQMTKFIFLSFIVFNLNVFSQNARVINHKGSIKVVDATPDAFANDIGNNAVILAAQSDGMTARITATDFVIKDSGNVGIGIDNPTVRFDIANGDVRFRDYPSLRDDSATNTVVNILYTDVNGNLLSGPLPPSSTLLHAEYAPSVAFNTNTAVETVGAFFGNEISNDGAIVQTSPSTLTINQAGIYDITFNCLLIGTNGARLAPMATLFINNTSTRIRAATGYMRRANGHERSSWNFKYKRRFNVGDILQIRTLRESNNGSNVNLDPNFTIFTITRLEG